MENRDTEEPSLCAMCWFLYATVLYVLFQAKMTQEDRPPCIIIVITPENTAGGLRGSPVSGSGGPCLPYQSGPLLDAGGNYNWKP